jgi:hypothetical protein
MSGRGSFSTYDEDSDVSSASTGSTPNAGLLAGYSTTLGRANTLSFSEALSLESLYSLGAFDSLAPDVPPGELPIDGPGQGIAEQRSLSSNTGIAFGRRLSRRDNVDLNYAYVTRVFADDEFGGGGTSQSAGLAYSRTLNRTTGLNVSYGYSNGEYTPISGAGSDRPLVGHTIDAGFRYVRRISARRAMQLIFGVGASRTTGVTGVEETPYSSWSPSGHVSAQIDLVRTWAIVGNYRREVSALDGLTGEAYIANTYGISIGGSAGPRTTLAIAAGYGSGGVPTGALVTSEYTNTTASAQLSVRILKNLSAVLQASLYRYDITGDASVPSGFPPGYDRSSIRVGVNWRQPIITPRTR